jgi:adenylate cyclase
MYAEAEECLNQAISVARRQGARLFELRAATSLARHLVGLGRTVDARQMLTTAIEPFGPELDTADRQTAWALLESMS